MAFRLKPHTLILFLSLLLAAGVLLSLNAGAYGMSWDRLPGALADTAGETAEGRVLWALRMPRIALAVLAGAALGLAGAALQALVRNPLADPGLLGISSGGALGAAIAAAAQGCLLPTLASVSWLNMSTGAALGSAAACWLIYKLGCVDGRPRITMMLLSGIAINAIANSLLGVMLYYVSATHLRSLTSWTLGVVSQADWSDSFMLAAVLLPVFAFLASRRRSLDALLLGDAEASHLGINVAVLQRCLVGVVAVLAGVSVSLCGTIGFVGLVAPHMARLLGGPSHRTVLAGSMLIGALVILASDTCIRSIAALNEWPVGNLTSLIGAPIFIALLWRARREFAA